MSSSGDSLNWKKGCGIGCGIVVALAVLAFAVSGLVFLKPFRAAIDTRESLDEKYGSQDTFTPPLDGAIPPHRIEAFLRVREQLQGLCLSYENSLKGMQSLERFDGEDEVPREELMKSFVQVIRSAAGMGPLMGKFFRERNRALLMAEMGLGEYTYLYALAYGDSLVVRRSTGEEVHLTNRVNRRIKTALQEMLRRQLMALEKEQASQPASGVVSANSLAAEAPTWLELLRAEIQALEGEGRYLPWEGALPTPIAVSLAPYRERLATVYCPHTVELELVRNRVFAGIGIHGD
jgi:hypothetical protein